MFEILENEVLTPNVHRMVICAPRIAKARQWVSLSLSGLKRKVSVSR